MAWDSPRRHDPLPRTLPHSNLSVDELDFYKFAPDLSSSNKDEIVNMHGQVLSPIHEERRFPASNAPLEIHVTAKFHDPAIRFTYNRSYYSSQAFIPTERICRGLLQRIKHCSEEVITRKDSDALNSTQCLRKGPKPLRFELVFKVTRAGHSGVWAEKSFKSHQKHPLTSASAQEVLLSTHRIVGLFMKRHDKGFEWTDEPGYDHFPNKPETFEPSMHGNLNVACIPRSLFIESRQTWEFVPGYTLELTFKSSNPARRQSVIRKTLRVDSEQNTPLNLGLGEDLLWQAQRFLQDVLDQKKNSFDLEHADCDGFDGLPDCDCQHFDEDALNVGLRVINNLGPIYDHLHRSTQSRLRLFTHPRGQDCNEFVDNIQSQLGQLRDQTDKKMEKLKDFDFRIAEFTGHGWHEKACARFVIGSEHNHSRRSIEALLDRIRTGVSDVLRGHDVAIRMVAYKRGHLILDKALIARDHQSTPGRGFMYGAKTQQQHLLGELKARIQHDIDMVCEDTCRVDDIPEIDPQLRQRNFSRPQSAFSSSRPVTPCETQQRQTRPGSPGSFRTRPPTTPVVPTRSSSRVFPLVPIKYQDEKDSRSKASSSVRNSAVGAYYQGDYRSFGLAMGAEAPTAGARNDYGKTTCTRESERLKPAAEVYPASKEEYETDSNSTHSSMPALTESDDAPSPDQSMLITPSCVRSSSPIPHRMSSMEDLRSHHFPSPFLMDTSAPNSSTFPDLNRFENANSAISKSTVLPSSRPGTPMDSEAEKSVPVNTPKAFEDASGNEKTPMPHRSLQADTMSGTDSDMTAKHTTTGSEPDAEALEKDDGITQCDSSETLRPSTVMEQRSIDGMVGLRGVEHTESRESASASVSYQSDLEMTESPSEIEGQHSAPTEQSRLGSRIASSEDDMRVMTADDDLSRSKIDFFEQEEDSARDPEAAEQSSQAQSGSRWMGMSESSEPTDHVIPSSDSGEDIRTISEAIHRSGSEVEKKRILSPIDESPFEFDVDRYETTAQGGEKTDLPQSEHDNASDPWVNQDIRRGDAILPVASETSTMDAVEIPESPTGKPKSAKKGSAPAASDPVKPSEIRASGSISTARAVSNPQPSPVQLGLSSGQLFPSLPIFSNLRSVSHDTRTSWSTSSSWEDISSGRRSSDSVDTIKASPTASEEVDSPDSPKRLGTPTAGLIGLHESRWAEFGIRAALMGPQACDRPSTAPLLDSPRNAADDIEHRVEPGQVDDQLDQESTSSPRKVLHLRPKKSIGSIITASKLKRKESKELRKQKSVELKAQKKTKSKSSKEATGPKAEDDGAARFPRAMMLVAGLAFASSVVSRNHN